MAQLRCADGRVLSVLPVPVLDREGTPYEVTLRLELDGRPFGDVGERCGFFLAALAERLGDGEPDGLVERGVRAWARERGDDPEAVWAGLRRHVPRDCELFCFRSRDPDDVGGAGELRGTLRRTRSWTGRAWQEQVEVVVDAWGDDGTAVRARLDPPGLSALLQQLLQDCAQLGVGYRGSGAARRAVP